MDYQFHFCDFIIFHFRPNKIQKSYGFWIFPWNKLGCTYLHEGFVAPLSLGCKELDGEHPRQCPWFISCQFLGCSHFFRVPGFVNFTNRKW